jgi:hypothetical protein
MLLAILLTLAAHAGPEDLRWRALLHFAGSSGGHSSILKTSPFFLSPTGYKDPAAEFAATEKFFHDKPEEAACRYPARAIFLGQPESHCPRWQKWQDALRAKGVELVFAAAFLSNPSSMYGHTLLKFPRFGETEGQDLLDYTLSYGADTGKVVGLPYIYMGLTGGFNGNYITAPFYLKVKEYNFVENRDFWIYPLKLTEAELRLLAAHAWEVREVAFPYYFLHRNCSFYLLEMMEVIRPGSNFTAHFPFWTIPIDTIRLLENANLLAAPHFRASRYRRLHGLRDQLAFDEFGIVEQLAATGEAALKPGRETLELDTAYELWRYRKDENASVNPAAEIKLLAARNQFQAPPTPVDLSPLRPPEEGHPSSRAYAALGTDRTKTFAEVGYRGSLQDILADPQGYEDYSELSMGDIRARVQEGKIFLERIDVMRLRSVAPRERWIPRFAWSFRTGFERAKEFNCTAWGCSAGEIEGGFGSSARLGPLVVFALLQGGFEAGKPFDRNYRFGAGPQGGVFTPLWKGARAIVEGEYRLRLMGSQLSKHSANAGIAQTFSPNWEARVTAEVDRGYREGLAQLSFYF